MSLFSIEDPRLDIKDIRTDNLIVTWNSKIVDCLINVQNGSNLFVVLCVEDVTSEPGVNEGYKMLKS